MSKKVIGNGMTIARYPAEVTQPMAEVAAALREAATALEGVKLHLFEELAPRTEGWAKIGLLTLGEVQSHMNGMPRHTRRLSTDAFWDYIDHGQVLSLREPLAVVFQGVKSAMTHGRRRAVALVPDSNSSMLLRRERGAILQAFDDRVRLDNSSIPRPWPPGRLNLVLARAPEDSPMDRLEEIIGAACPLQMILGPAEADPLNT